MNDLPIDLGFLRERVRELREELCDETPPSLKSTGATRGDPTLVCDALLQLFDVLDRADAMPGGAEMTTLGEYGLHLLEELGALVDESPAGTGIAHLCLPFALLVARNGGELRNLAPVVNALAFQANEQSRPKIMAGLYTHCCELLDAASPTQQEAINERPDHPYRALLLKRAIIATRTHNPDLIIPAFDAIVETIPDDGAGFFAEAMEQMTVLEYPDRVKDVVRQYFVRHARPRQLH